MDKIDEVLNSGKLYKVWEFTGECPTYCRDLDLVEKFNSLGYSKQAEAEKAKILKELFAEIGEGSYIQAPFHAMCAGRHVHLGKNVYFNFNATFVDDAQIYVGDNTMVAPNVTIATGSHPISPKLRMEGYGCNKPVHIGKNCWLGSNVVVLPGVTIGDNSVIGAGSVVTRDIPANCFAAGNPARVIRKITEEDDVYYDHGKPIAENIVRLEDIKNERPRLERAGKFFGHSRAGALHLRAGGLCPFAGQGREKKRAHREVRPLYAAYC